MGMMQKTYTSALSKTIEVLQRVYSGINTDKMR